MIVKLQLNKSNNKILNIIEDELYFFDKRKVTMFGYTFLNNILILDIDFDDSKQTVWIVGDEDVLEHSDYLKMYNDYIRTNKLKRLIK